MKIWIFIEHRLLGLHLTTFISQYKQCSFSYFLIITVFCDASSHDGVSLSCHLINVLAHLYFNIWCLFQSLSHQIDGVGPVYFVAMVTGQKWWCSSGFYFTHWMFYYRQVKYMKLLLPITSIFMFECFKFCGNYKNHWLPEFKKPLAIIYSYSLTSQMKK